MIKYKYSIEYIEILSGIKHKTIIEAASFADCVKKFNNDYPYFEIIKLIRL